MVYFLRINVFLLALFLSGGIFLNAHAHAGEDHSSSYNLAAIHLAQDESVDPESLGVSAPKILPGNPLYFFKNFARGTQSTFAFSAEKKAELKLNFANEKIVEAQILSDRGDKTRAVEHLKSYEKDLAGAKKSANVERFIAQSFIHQAILDKIEKEASAENMADIKEVRDKAVEHIAEAVAGAQDPEKAKNALISASNEEGSSFKPLRNLEVLKAIEEKVPEQAKAGVQLAQENAVKRFKSDYEKSSGEEKEALTDYIKSAGGDASRYIEAFNENKEALGEELSGKLLSAGEEKKAVTGTGTGTSVIAFSPDNVECVPPVSPKPIESKSEVGEMTITPEISQAGKDNVITVSFSPSISPLSVGFSHRFSVFTKSNVIDWGPKKEEIRKELAEEAVVVEPQGNVFVWQTFTPDYVIERTKIRPRLPAQKYWVKFRAPDQTIPWDSDENIGSYGWREIEYSIHYFVGDGSKQSDYKTSKGKGFYYVSGPQHPTGELLRVGANTQHPFGDFVTVKAGGTFDVEAKVTGQQGATMTLQMKNHRVIGPASIAVKAGESAVWKVLPTNASPAKGQLEITNNCSSILQSLLHSSGHLGRSWPAYEDSFESFVRFDFQGVAKDKVRLTLYGAIAYVLDFAKPDSALNITPGLDLMDGKSFVVGVPETDIIVQAVYKDNPKEIAKNILVTPGIARTNKEGRTSVKITAPNVTKEEVTRGIILKLTAPSIPGLIFEQKLLFTNITIDVTPPPVVEKKEEPKAEVKQEPKTEETKPYQGSPPLLY